MFEKDPLFPGAGRLQKNKTNDDEKSKLKKDSAHKRRREKKIP